MVKSVYASNATTPQTCGSRGVMYRKYCFQSATQEGTAIKLTLRRNSRTLPYLVNDMPMRREDSKHPCFCDPFHVCVKMCRSRGAEEPTVFQTPCSQLFTTYYAHTCVTCGC